MEMAQGEMVVAGSIAMRCWRRSDPLAIRSGFQFIFSRMFISVAVIWLIVLCV